MGARPAFAHNGGMTHISVARGAVALAVVPALFLALTASTGLAAEDDSPFIEITGGVAQGPAVFISDWGHVGSGDAEMDTPLGVAIGPQLHVFIADSGNDRIKRTYPSGDLWVQWGTPGTGDGQFDDPCGIAVTPAGDVLVVERGNQRVQRFSASGAHRATWGTPGSGPGQLSTPCGVAVDSGGRVYVADTGNDRIEVYGSGGHFLRALGGPGTGSGVLDGPLGVAVGRDGRVYVADTGNDRVQVFSPTGTVLDHWDAVAGGTGLGRLEAPSGIATDAAGRVYVTDTGSRRIQRYTVDGAPLSTWGAGGSGPGQFADPFGIAVSRRGEVVVADQGNHRFQRWGWNRPDATIGSGAHGRQVGDGVYNTTGAGQRRMAVVGPGGAATYVAEFSADGAVFSSLRLRGGGSTRDFTVAYWTRGHDITDAVLDGTFVTRHVTPDRQARIRIVVTARSGADPGAAVDRVLRATATYGVGTDVVGFVTHRR